MRVTWKPLLLSLALPLAVGGLASLLTGDDMEAFSQLSQPPLSPPGWLFPVVWTALYLMMGLASCLVWTKGRTTPEGRRGLLLYGLQLGANFLWSLLFFHWKLYLGAFLWLVLLWGLILACLAFFSQTDRRAAWLMTPYLLWVTFAGYLNFGIWLLNG